MQKSLIFLSIIFASVILLSFQEDIQTEKGSTTLRKVNNEAFTHGEKLKYRLHYGWITAGEAILEIEKDPAVLGNRECFHITGTGTSTGSFDWFFKVRDRYETYLDKEALAPWFFVRRVNEGGFIINQNYSFNHFKQTVITENYKEKPEKQKDTLTIPQYIQDMLSSFYYARSIDFSTAKEGDVFTVQSFIDNEVYPLKIKFVGRVNLKTDLGKFRCLKFRPVIQQGRVFKHEEDMNVWVTDDKNHVPVRAEAKILVGSIKMDLEEYAGLANPLALLAK